MEIIDDLDKKILTIITHNARIPFKDVAEQCGVSRAAVHQRVQRMFDIGVIIGSGYQVNPKMLGYNMCGLSICRLVSRVICANNSGSGVVCCSIYSSSEDIIVVG